MQENKLEIDVLLPDKKINLTIFGESSGSTLIEVPDAAENGEATYQIKEGCYYEYKISDNYSLAPSEIVSRSKVDKSSGRIAPNIYVGTLSIDVLDKDEIKCGEVKLEVQSVKTSYREDYRYMLEEITEMCTDLLLQHSSPVSQNFETNFDADSKTLYQRFAFIKSIIDSEEFNDSVHKIISAPVTKWKESEVVKDIRSVRRFSNSSIKQLVSASNRINLPEAHPLKDLLNSIPSTIKTSNKTESLDTPENRFVKHALVSFQNFCSDLLLKTTDSSRLKTEAELLIDKLEQFLSHSIFKEISPPKTLPLNSPVLQRKEGYREVLSVWLMFDLAAKLVWHGGEDVYRGNKKDIAVLYEYWLFFKLLEIVKEVFNIEPKNIEELIKKTDDGLGLQLKQGQYLPIKGIYESATRKLHIEFSYNRTFSGANNYPDSGSWTRSMRPDYTLSIWPHGIDAETAEREELIVHVHCDAKYKVERLNEILGDEIELDSEKDEQRKGKYKRADLLKMHTYKDAIRRTAGAYVLYPGTDEKYIRSGFHELIPGLGAFAVRPSKTDNGTQDLKNFLNEVTEHFLNRASQREKTSLGTYETYKDDNINNVKELLPETYGENRSLLPDATSVIVGFCKSKEQYNWVVKNGIYNFRTGSGNGSIKLEPKVAGAKYLLLRLEGSRITGELFKIIEIGPKLFSKEDLIKKGYPTTPSQNFYLIYKIEKVKDKEFLNIEWDISALDNFKSGNRAADPFAVTLTDLMKVLKK
ncbi:MAG: DUF2357 domain-containing protein [Ignavibacteria bacterium]|nr:DUF2357 domain-containing protein [Ignavibacteria bacterium]